MNKWNDSPQNEPDEAVNVNLANSSFDNFKITSLQFAYEFIGFTEDSYGLLSLGLSDGRVLIAHIPLPEDRILNAFNSIDDLETYKKSQLDPKTAIMLVNTQPQSVRVLKTELALIDEKKNTFLLIILQDICLKFALIEIKKDKIETHFDLVFLLNELNYNLRDLNEPKNSISQAIYRIIDFKLNRTSALNARLTLIFESSLVDCFQVEIASTLNELSILRPSKSYFKIDEANSSKGELFKSTRQVFLSTNRCLVFQIADFEKSNLIQKRSPHFGIQIFRVISEEEVSFESYYTSTKRSIIEQNDFVWLSKQMLYLRNSQYLDMVYVKLNQFLKKIKTQILEKVDNGKFLL